MKILGNIIDVTGFSFNESNSDMIFALDTNVILWTFYSRVSSAEAYQKTIYPDFISNAIENGNTLIVSAFNLNEVFHVIEKNEMDIYNKSNGTRVRIKDFRKMQPERENVKKEIELIHNQIKAIPNISIVGAHAELEHLNRFANKYDVHNCDFFDFWLINHCNENSYSILTDDRDFNNDFVNVDIYSANPIILPTL